MTDLPADTALPAHVDETVKAIAALHADHHRRATPVQRVVAGLVEWLGRPRFVGLITAAMVCWIALNLSLGRRALDEPPFFVMANVVAVLSLYMTVLILITQRHEDELTELREQLTLELAILSEQKSAKIIKLLEELRRDSPQIADRQDAEAAALSDPADPRAVLSAIQNQDDLAGSPPERKGRA